MRVVLEIEVDLADQGELSRPEDWVYHLKKVLDDYAGHFRPVVRQKRTPE